jgi:16S rRNA A1518/A1519 N6-dimethyltransferase RsmA/KsgA/DIM1 with predicted DNA glycosylase/AP lyase activity
MIQREVADRILAPPGTGEYGALSVGVRSVATVERCSTSAAARSGRCRASIRR